MVVWVVVRSVMSSESGRGSCHSRPLSPPSPEPVKKGGKLSARGREGWQGGSDGRWEMACLIIDLEGGLLGVDACGSSSSTPGSRLMDDE